MQEVLDNLKARPCGIISDNASNIRKACKELCNRFPQLISIGCSAHWGNLTLKDLLHRVSTKLTVKQGSTIAKYFRNSTHSLAELMELQKLKKLPAPHTPPSYSAVRWSSLKNLLTWLEVNREVIRMVTCSSFCRKNMDEKTQKLIEKEKFWIKVTALKGVVLLLNEFIDHAQSDDSNLGSVFQKWKDMQKKLKARFVHSSERFIHQVINKREEFFCACLPPGSKKPG